MKILEITFNQYDADNKKPRRKKKWMEFLYQLPSFTGNGNIKAVHNIAKVIF
jgi:hypothetical protein